MPSIRMFWPLLGVGGLQDSDSSGDLLQGHLDPCGLKGPNDLRTVQQVQVLASVELVNLCRPGASSLKFFLLQICGS